MADYRIREHPILAIEERAEFEFAWQGQAMRAHAGEVIASALFANGVRTFGHTTRTAPPRASFAPTASARSAW